MPDIYDEEKGLTISLTDEDYEDYKNGKLSDDFYARRSDGSIANKVNIRRTEDDNYEDEEESQSDSSPDTLDPASAVIGALIMAALAGAAYGIKKLWDRHKAKKAEAQIAKQRKAQELLQNGENIQTLIEPAVTVLSTETVNVNNEERKSLTQEEAIQELMKIIVGMAEIADGNKKVSEGVENLSNAGVVDKKALLERLSKPETLESFNAYLSQNPQLAMQNQTALNRLFDREVIDNRQFVPISMLEIEKQMIIENKTEE